MDACDIALLVVTGYIAVLALVRLMSARHQALVAELRRHMPAQRRRERPERTSKAA